MEPLKSIEEEAAACRAAFVGVEVGALVRLCHHGVPVEVLTEPAEARIAYILAKKSFGERALRLRCFRPLDPQYVTNELAAARAKWSAAREKWNAACAEWNAASEKWNAACEKWNAACEKWDATREKWNAARAKWSAACKKWNAARAKRSAACEKWNAACEKWGNTPQGIAALADTPWDGWTIFAEVKR